MPLDFPSSPTNGQYYNGFVWNAANETWDSAYNTQTMPQGRIAQVVSATYSTYTINSEVTFASTGLSASITPKFSSSKIVIFYHINGAGKLGSALTTACLSLQLRKDGTSIQTPAFAAGYALPADSRIPTISGTYTETAGSTTARTYDLAFAEGNSGAGGVFVQRESATSSMVILEITA